MRQLALAVVLAIVAGCSSTAPIESVVSHRIGYLSSGGQVDTTERVSGLRSALAQFGYVEGQNVSIDVRYSDGNNDRLPALAKELIALQPSLIVAPGVFEALALKEATTVVPIVLAGVPDPVENGLVNSLAHPSGNITGTGRQSAGLAQLRLQLLKEIAPAVSRVGIFYDPSNVNATRVYDEARGAGATLGLTVVPVAHHNADSYRSALANTAGAQLDGVFVLGSTTDLNQKTLILDFVSAHRLPALYGGYRDFVDAGGLMFYGENAGDATRRSASYVDKILKGAKAGDLPIERTSKFDLVINLRTASALGLTVSKALLDKATDIVQ